MWGIKGSVPRLILLGSASSILMNAFVLGILMALYSQGIQLFYSVPLLAVSAVSCVVGMITVSSITYAFYLDERESFPRVCGTEPVLV
jgi:hypothetical protein